MLVHPSPNAVTCENNQSTPETTQVSFIQHRVALSCRFPVAICVMMEVTQEDFLYSV